MRNLCFTSRMYNKMAEAKLLKCEFSVMYEINILLGVIIHSF